MPRKRKGTNFTRKKKKVSRTVNADVSGTIPHQCADTGDEMERQSISTVPSQMLVAPSQMSVAPSQMSVAPPQMLVARGSWGQNNVRYSEDSRNHQCTANAAVALAYDELIPFSAWNTQIVDNILDYGDHLYKKSFLSRTLQNSSDSVHLLVTEVFPNFIIDNVFYTLHIKDMVTGHMNEGLEINGESVPLAQELEQVFQNNKSAILTHGLKSICVNKKNLNDYYVFDSLSRKVEGMGKKDEGKACLLRFLNISELTSFLLHNCDNEPFTLVPIKVQIGSIYDLPEPDRYHVLKIYTETSDKSRRSKRISDISNKSDTQASTIVEEKEIPLHYLGALDRECFYCGALSFLCENTYCCKYGAVSLPADSVYPDLLKALLTDMHPQSSNFIKNIRRYNTLMALGSTSFSQRGGLTRGAPVIVLSGQIYHSVGSVNPLDPKFGSLYFLESGEATRRRKAQGFSDGCDSKLLEQIDKVLRDNHPFARMYRTLGQMVQYANRIGGKDTVPQLGLYFHNQPSTDRKIHAAPSTCDEIGAVFRTVDGDIPPPGIIRVNLVNSDSDDSRFQIKDIPKLSPIVDALCYPLLFPNGELGWSRQMLKSGSEKRIGKREFECYRLMTRADRFNPILLAGRLTQQFIVDKYVELEGDRLSYLRTHQLKLRAESYVGLQDYVARKVGAQQSGGERVGKIVILPSTFTGGARYMRQNYQDAMAIVAKFGKPSLFVTFTCNPNWLEITENLGSKLLNPLDRPDVIARVFDLKRRAFFDDVLHSNIFGKVIAFIYVIEFQKRGLPHMHCLLTLADRDKLRDPEDVDKMICAELPPENTRLFNVIMSSMIHGPCGSRCPDSPCMIDGECSKGYPKSFSERTKIDKSRPVYRRRNDGRTASFMRNRTSCTVDNRDVVPYSPYLSMKYECHINVEVVTSVSAVKYLFKHINKGPDAAVLQLRNEIVFDEIQAFVESRYVSSGEAAWRLLALPIQGKSHTIYRLPVHLPGERVVYFEEGKEEVALQYPKLSPLEAYFELNMYDPSARKFKYSEIPLHYCYIPSKHRWSERSRRRSVIPRLYTISPKFVEKFYLRVLLLNVAGPTSFEDLRTFNGVTYPTFLEAARVRDLIASDFTWEKTLEHAAKANMPGCMRKLFVYLLCFCEVGNPVALWVAFKGFMCQDYRRKEIFSESQFEDCALRRIGHSLRFLGKNLKDFHLPEPNCDMVDDDDEGPNSESADLDPKTLNPQQRHVFDRVVAALESSAVGGDRYFYLQGSGGTGKTYLYNNILEYCERSGLPSIAVAFTGIAALLLRNGRTVHSTFRLPLELDADSRSSITAQSEEAEHLRSLRLIIWDEVSMANYHIINMVDELLRDVCRDPRPFGGKCILLGGDVKQLLPVATGRVQQVELFFTNCKSWNSFKVLRLSTNMRAAAGEDDFIQWLEDLGLGATNVKVVKDIDSSKDFVCVPPRCLTTDVVREIYGQLDTLTPEELAVRAVLCPKNEHCNMLNDRILEAFPGPFKTVLSNDSVASGDEDEVANFPEEYLNSITPSGIPPHELKLKVGVPIILLRNVSLADGLINGTRLLVLAVTDLLLTAEIVTGRLAGRKVFIPRLDLISTDKDVPFILKRRQFPVKVCFALTINKAQGQTFERVGIFLPTPVFSHGQLYVAFSRARSWDTVKVEIIQQSDQGELEETSSKVFTKNIVFSNVLDAINK